MSAVDGAFSFDRFVTRTDDTKWDVFVILMKSKRILFGGEAHELQLDFNFGIPNREVGLMEGELGRFATRHWNHHFLVSIGVEDKVVLEVKRVVAAIGHCGDSM